VILTTCYAAGLRISEAARLKVAGAATPRLAHRQRHEWTRVGTKLPPQASNAMQSGRLAV